MVTNTLGNPTPWTIMCDDSCPVVRFLARLVKNCDKRRVFTIVGRNDQDPQNQKLAAEFESSPWSLLLVDDELEHWHGPDAIPYILKHLPSGRIAVVAYTLPGTMWVTRQFYFLVSRNRKRLAKINLPASTTTNSTTGSSAHHEAA
jgi:predicted DCC family thiol-disulfide oxidoreductase YuxK